MSTKRTWAPCPCPGAGPGSAGSRLRPVRTDVDSSETALMRYTHLVRKTRSPASDHGLWRRLVARLTGGQEVVGSNPASPTTFPRVRVRICLGIRNEAQVLRRGERLGLFLCLAYSLAQTDRDKPYAPRFSLTCT